MVEGPVAGKKIKRRTIRNLITGSVVVLVLFIVAGGGYYLFNSLAEKARKEAEEKLANTVSSLAAPYEKTVNATRKGLQSLAKDTALIELFKQGDTQALESAAAEKREAVPNALNLRFFMPGGYDLETEGDYALGFASIDLLRGIEKDEAASGAEVQKFGSPDEHIVMVEGVKDGEGNLVGLIHLVAGLELFRVPLEKMDPGAGYAELHQSIAGRAVVLGKKGDASAKQGKPVEYSIANSRWGIAYWPKGGAAAVEGSGPGLLAIVIAVLVLAAAGGAVFFYMKKGQPMPGKKKASGVVYQGAVKAIMEGTHPGVEPLIPDLPDTGTKKPPRAASISPGAQVEEAIANNSNAPAAPATGTIDFTAAETPVKATPAPAQEAAPPPVEVSETMFRAYDIRGIVDTDLTAEVVNAIGKAIGSEALAAGQQGIVVGRDGRTHSPKLAEALIQGLQSTGQDVIDIGMVPTPVLYFATHTLEARSGVMLTGSHNGPEYNGLKIVIGGDTLSGDAIMNLYRRIKDNDFSSGQGSLQSIEIITDYIRKITEDIPVALGNAFKIVIDAGNGIAGAVAPQLYRAMGHDVVEIYCDVDGNFPNHHPDPSQPENLADLIAKVGEEQADIGFAFDGDGDRLGVVDGEGNIIWPDRQLMLLAKDVLSRNAGAQIIYDVKCSRYLKVMIESCGGIPLMWKTGHSLIKAKMKEVDAPLAGEMSGHIFFKERWYGFDDALYTGARMLEVLTASQAKPAVVFAAIPEGVSTPELRVKLAESEHGPVMSALLQVANFEDAEISEIDGLRADFADGWGLVRPSNTSPYLVLRFEAESQQVLEKIQNRFRECLLAVKDDFELPF